MHIKHFSAGVPHSGCCDLLGQSQQVSHIMWVHYCWGCCLVSWLEWGLPRCFTVKCHSSLSLTAALGSATFGPWRERLFLSNSQQFLPGLESSMRAVKMDYYFFYCSLLPVSFSCPSFLSPCDHSFLDIYFLKHYYEHVGFLKINSVYNKSLQLLFFSGTQCPTGVHSISPACPLRWSLWI